MEFNSKDFSRIIDDQRRAKPEAVGRIETIHYTLLWHFDLLALCLKYLVKIDRARVAQSNIEMQVKNLDPKAAMTIEEDF